MWNRTIVLQTATNPEKWVKLPSGSLAYLLAALSVMATRSEWIEMSDLDWDEMETALADTEDALLSEEGTLPTMQIGSIFMWANSGPPPGCLFCDGAEYAAVDYPDLYDLLYAWFPGSDVDHFCVPDMQNRFPWGAETATPGWQAGDIGGESEHTLTEDELAAHDHTTEEHTHMVSAHQHTTTASANTALTYNLGTFTVVRPAATNTGLAEINIATAPVTVNAAGGGEAHNNMPPWMNLAFVIVAE